MEATGSKRRTIDKITGLIESAEPNQGKQRKVEADPEETKEV